MNNFWVFQQLFFTRNHHVRCSAWSQVAELAKQGVHLLMCENVLVSHPVLCNKSMVKVCSLQSTLLDCVGHFLPHKFTFTCSDYHYCCAGTLINMHNIHNLWSPQKCAGINAVQIVELRHLAIARAQTCILVSRDCNTDVTSCGARQKPQKLTLLYTRYILYVLISFATVSAIKGLAAAS